MTNNQTRFEQALNIMLMIICKPHVKTYERNDRLLLTLSAIALLQPRMAWIAIMVAKRHKIKENEHISSAAVAEKLEMVKRTLEEAQVFFQELYCTYSTMQNLDKQQEMDR